MAIKSLKSQIESAGENIKAQLAVFADLIDSLDWGADYDGKYRGLARKIRNAKVYSNGGELVFDFILSNETEIAGMLGISSDDVRNPVKLTAAITDKVTSLGATADLRKGRIAQLEKANQALEEERQRLAKICDRRKIATRVVAGILAATVLAGVLFAVLVNKDKEIQTSGLNVGGEAAYLAILSTLEGSGVDIDFVDIGDYINSIQGTAIYEQIQDFLEENGHEIPEGISIGDYVEGLHQEAPEVEAPMTLEETNLSAYLKIVNSLKTLGYEIDDTTDISDFIDALDDNPDNADDIQNHSALAKFLEDSGFDIPEELTLGEYIESLRGDYGNDNNVDVDYDLPETNESAYYKVINLLEDNGYEITNDTDISDLINSLDDDPDNAEALELREKIIDFLGDNEFELAEDTDIGQFVEDLMPQVPTYEEGVQDGYQAIIDILEENGFDVDNITGEDGLLDLDAIDDEIAPFVQEAIANAGIVDDIVEEIDSWLNLYGDDLDNYISLNIGVEALRNHINGNENFDAEDIEKELGYFDNLIEDLKNYQEKIAEQQILIDNCQNLHGVSDKTDGTSSNEITTSPNAPVSGGSSEDENNSDSTSGAGSEEVNDNYPGRK